DVGSYQRRWLPIPRKSAVQDHVVALGHDDGVLVAQCIGERANEIEQTVPARFDMGAMLNVVLRPKACCSCDGGAFVQLWPMLMTSLELIFLQLGLATRHLVSSAPVLSPRSIFDDALRKHCNSVCSIRLVLLACACRTDDRPVATELYPAIIFSPENAASDWVPVSFPSTVAIPGARIRD